MHPLLLVGLGIGVGVVRERVYSAWERALGPKDTAKHVAKGFLTEASTAKNLILRKKKKETTYVITVDDKLEDEEILACLAERILDRRKKPPVTKTQPAREVQPVNG